MDLRPTPEQEQLVATFAALFAKHATPEHVRAAEPRGFDPALWEQLLDLGVVTMGVGEPAGGWGASLLDLALVTEQLGRVVAPAPVAEAQAAARLLERLPGDAAAATLASVVDDGRLVTLALSRSTRMVPAAAVADAAIVPSEDALLLVPLGDGVATPVANLGSMPVADLAADAIVGPEVIVLARGPEAAAAHGAAVDDWLALTAAALVGLGQRALEIGVAYVKERHAWGVPIGSFQAVAHRLADSATALDGAQLVAREAAWAATARPERHGELAAMAFGLAYEAARDASYRSLHFHGGYGFMMEYAIQLYYRRARAWATVFGGPTYHHRRIADKRYGPLPTASGSVVA